MKIQFPIHLAIDYHVQTSHTTISVRAVDMLALMAVELAAEVVVLRISVQAMALITR